jgi:RNA polymerase sigma-70 factor, ECF subfamily
VSRPTRPSDPRHLLELREAVARFRTDGAAGLARSESTVAAAPLPGPRGLVRTPEPAPVADDTPFESTPDGVVVMEIVARAQAGDAEAFGQLYDRYVDLVYRYVYYRVGTTTLAEDLVSETFLRALRRITSFTWQGRDFAAWLITIARNLIADHYKSGRYRLEVATEDMLAVADGASASSPEGEVLDALTNRTLLEAVKELNAEQQECVVLRFLQGLSVTETALAMGKTEGAIKALQYRAVRTLGRLLPKEMVL